MGTPLGDRVDDRIVEPRAEQRRPQAGPVVKHGKRGTHGARTDDGDHGEILRAPARRRRRAGPRHTDPVSAFELREAISLCWLVFVVVWVLASGATKRTAERPGNQVPYRVMWFAAFGLLFLSRPRRNALGSLGRAVLPADSTLAAVGLVLAIAGLAFAIWARATLGRNWSGTIQFKEDHTLVDRGPYAIVRHPIYTAILIMFVGTALAYGTLGALLAVPLAVVSFVIKARQEEELMEKHFPEEYAAYRARTRMIVPLVF